MTFFGIIDRAVAEGFRFLQFNAMRLAYAAVMIILTTPTGNIGSKVLRELLAHSSEPLRVIARDPKKLPADLPKSVEIVQGQTDDSKLLQHALKGADVLFWCQPDTPGAVDYIKAYEDWSHIALAAINAASVPRIVAISSAGDAPAVPAGPVSALHRMEQILSKSSAHCRFLRCGSFYSNLLWQWESITRDGVFAYGMQGNVRGPQVAPEDIARVAARQLIDRDWKGKEAISLLGPQDLSYDDLAAELTLQLGRPVRYEAMPAEAYRDLSIQLGLSESGAQGLLDMFDYLATGYRTDPEADRSLTPMTFAEWLRTALRDLQP